MKTTVELWTFNEECWNKSTEKSKWWRVLG